MESVGTPGRVTEKERGTADGCQPEDGTAIGQERGEALVELRRVVWVVLLLVAQLWCTQPWSMKSRLASHGCWLDGEGSSLDGCGALQCG